MTVVDVNVSKHYKVLIGSGLLDSLGQEAAKVTKGRKVCLVSDSHVWPLYGEKAVQSLAQTGFETIHYTFSAGEESKNGSTYLTLINYLSENQLTRSDCLVALGGGVVGDLTGFHTFRCPPHCWPPWTLPLAERLPLIYRPEKIWQGLFISRILCFAISIRWIRFRKRYSGMGVRK